MTQFNPNSQSSANSPAQPSRAGPNAPDNPQALEQTTVKDSDSAQILQLVQKCYEILSALNDKVDSNAKAIEGISVDIQQMTQGSTSGGASAVLS